jgi:hypothetical protein
MNSTSRSRGAKLFLFTAGFLLVGLILGSVVGTQDALYDSNASDAGSNQPSALINLIADPKDHANAGSAVYWSAKASKPDDDIIFYQFWLNGPATGNTWKTKTNWTADSFWKWMTNSEDIGNNIIEVRIRDGNHAGPNDYDDRMTSEYRIEENVNQKPSIISLKPDKVSPQNQGSQIIWTAKASDPDADTVLYQFWLKGASTDEDWIPMTDWTTKNVWTWSSSSTKTGMYTVEVRARDGYHAGPEGKDDFRTSNYVIRQFVV